MTKIKKDLDASLRQQAKNRCGYCLNPRTQNWNEHSDFTADKTEIIGKTSCGRATGKSLQINNFHQTTARSIWVEMPKF